MLSPKRFSFHNTRYCPTNSNLESSHIAHQEATSSFVLFKERSIIDMQLQLDHIDHSCHFNSSLDPLLMNPVTEYEIFPSLESTHTADIGGTGAVRTLSPLPSLKEIDARFPPDGSRDEAAREPDFTNAMIQCNQELDSFYHSSQPDYDLFLTSHDPTDDSLKDSSGTTNFSLHNMSNAVSTKNVFNLNNVQDQNDSHGRMINESFSGNVEPINFLHDQVYSPKTLEETWSTSSVYQAVSKEPSLNVSSQNLSITIESENRSLFVPSVDFEMSDFYSNIDIFGSQSSLLHSSSARDALHTVPNISYPTTGSSNTEKLVCAPCHTKFSSKRELNAHKRQSHPKRKVVPCKEKTCTQSFSAKCNMTKHYKSVHMRLKPHKCPRHKCNKSFSEHNKLKKHIESVHEAKRPFFCEYVSGCTGTFGQRSDMTRHIDIVHKNIKLFRCNTCNKGFGRKSSLGQHLLRIHMLSDTEVSDVMRLSKQEIGSEGRIVHSFDPDPSHLQAQIN